MAYTGVYERTIFYNPVNKYSVISVKTSDRSIPEKARSAYRHRDNMIHFAAVGYELPRTDQVSMILDGEWKEGKNGVQLHVTQCEEVVPQTRESNRVSNSLPAMIVIRTCCILTILIDVTFCSNISAKRFKRNFK